MSHQIRSAGARLDWPRRAGPAVVERALLQVDGGHAGFVVPVADGRGQVRVDAREVSGVSSTAIAGAWERIDAGVADARAGRTLPFGHSREA